MSVKILGACGSFGKREFSALDDAGVTFAAAARLPEALFLFVMDRAFGS